MFVLLTSSIEMTGVSFGHAQIVTSLGKGSYYIFMISFIGGYNTYFNSFSPD